MRNASLEGSSRWKQFLFLVAARYLSKASGLRRLARNFGQCADFIQWQVDHLSPAPDLKLTREDLWGKMIAALDPKGRIVVWEFGVAWGYCAQWWLARLKTESLVWHGFDRFTGLPRAWRDYPAGTYDAGGRPPDIKDPRVRWHVGDVEETLPKIDLTRERDSQWVVLFDLDIYEPTQFAWRAVRFLLRPGDLVYFDEAFDSDERRLLDEIISDRGRIKTSLLASTPISLVLRVD